MKNRPKPRGKLAKRLAEQIRERRGKVPKYHFHKTLGIGNTTLHSIELGTENVTLDLLETICDHLHCDISELFPPLPKPKLPSHDE
jgi:DNA-binding Xre family transcriptional regulator